MLNYGCTGVPAADKSDPTKTDVVTKGFIAATSVSENISPSASSVSIVVVLQGSVNFIWK
jgi:hypothetical protein